MNETWEKIIKINHLIESYIPDGKMFSFNKIEHSQRPLIFLLNFKSPFEIHAASLMDNYQELFLKLIESIKENFEGEDFILVKNGHTTFEDLGIVDNGLPNEKMVVDFLFNLGPFHELKILALDKTHENVYFHVGVDNMICLINSIVKINQLYVDCMNHPHFAFENKEFVNVSWEGKLFGVSVEFAFDYQCYGPKNLRRFFPETISVFIAYEDKICVSLTEPYETIRKKVFDYFEKIMSVNDLQIMVNGEISKYRTCCQLLTQIMDVENMGNISIFDKMQLQLKQPVKYIHGLFSDVWEGNRFFYQMQRFLMKKMNLETMVDMQLKGEKYHLDDDTEEISYYKLRIYKFMVYVFGFSLNEHTLYFVRILSDDYPHLYSRTIVGTKEDVELKLQIVMDKEEETQAFACINQIGE